ncbi:UPF0158 family protein [Algibacter sp. 2305UL17-15]|uniref:UPF0158 family protein n=1 Tax=Algibacter sp. 2305UL17-15 TaxID=3231268 RepID=UPI0034577162
MQKSKIINEIAQSIDCGYDCYYNPKTGRIIEIPDLSTIYDQELFEEAFQSDLETIETYEDDFIKIEPLESFEAFKIMERFVDQLPENTLKSKLETALQRKKPFQNFKYLVDHSDFRESWFKFKQNELEKIVADILE